jgi:multiple sugar transport system permease protein
MKAFAEMSTKTHSRAGIVYVGKTLNYVALIGVSIILLIPFLWMVATSLKPDGEVMTVPLTWFGHRIAWDNYARVMTFLPFGVFIINSAIVAVLGTALTLLTSSLSAYAFARLRFKGRDKLFLAYLATLMVPQQVVIIPMFLLMNYFGWVNSYQALIVPWAFTAFGTFLLRQFFMSVPYEFDEAARMEGASHFGIYWRIILPMATAGLATLAVFTFRTYWNNFLWPLIIVNKQNLMTLPLGLGRFQGQFGTQWNLLMAGAAISVVPALLLYVFAQRYIIAGIQFSGMGGR